MYYDKLLLKKHTSYETPESKGSSLSFLLPSVPFFEMSPDPRWKQYRDESVVSW